MTWDTTKDRKLAEMWATGLKARLIAESFSDGTTKGAVIGRANRLKLPPRGVRRVPPPDRRKLTPSLPARHSPHVVSNKRKVIVATGAHPTPPVHPRLTVAGTPRMLSVLELDKHCCHWPLTENPPHRFCGRPADPKATMGPYCTEHWAMCCTAYVPKFYRGTRL